MIPATKQYPRPNLPLLRQRIKRRDERQLIETNGVRLENLATATEQSHRLLKCGGSHTTRKPAAKPKFFFFFRFFSLENKQQFAQQRTPAYNTSI